MYILLFIITILLSLKTSWTYNNFTYLSYQNDLRIYYLLWVSCISIFLLYKVVKIYRQFTYFTKSDWILITTSFITMLVGSFLPYHPDSEDLFSSLHIILSMLGAITILLIIFILINCLMNFDFSLYQKMTSLYRSQLLILGMLIVMFGNINSIIELYFTAIVLYNLAKIEKSTT